MIQNMFRKAMASDDAALSLDFTTGVLDPRLTFTRSTTGTYINSSGYVTSAAINAPRFDYDPTTLAPRGLLIEGSTSNLCQQGQYCWGNGSTFSWVRSAQIHINSVNGTSGASAVPRIDGPDNGTSTGTSIFKESGSTFVRSNIDATVIASTQYTYSMWVRAGTNGTTNFRLAPFNGGSALTTVGACSDPSVGIHNGPGFGTRFSNLPTDRWVRVWVVFTTAAGQTTATLTIYPNLDTSAASTNYIWGAQLELGNGASSTIPTGVSQGFRAQDQMQMANLTALNFNTAAGTMLINGTYNRDADSFPRTIRFMGSSVQSMSMITSGKILYGNAPNTSGGSYIETSRTLSAFGAFKYGFTVTTAANPALATATVSLNGAGTTITPVGQGAITNPVTLDFLYGASATSDYPSMALSSFKYFASAMTSADLNVRTT